MNVQTSNKGIRINNVYATPLTDNTDGVKNNCLNNFYIWLKVWCEMEAAAGKWTRETFTALTHTTHGIIEITKFCISELNVRYILTSKFQTNKLESRFGQATSR